MTDLDAILHAIEQDDLTAAMAILERNRHLVSQTDSAGATALHYAALNGRRRIAQLLIEQGADVNHRDGEFGATPAGWAIEYLRELGGHLAIELEDLAYAIQTQDTKWVRRFLARFPGLRTAAYKNQITFQQLAVDCADPEIAQLFADVPA